jgi:hypothetical protein
MQIWRTRQPLAGYDKPILYLTRRGRTSTSCWVGRSSSSSSEYARFAALLPEMAAVVLRRERSPRRMASAGVRLGGLLAWGVEQARFSAELAGSEISEACKAEAFKPVPRVPGGEFTLGAQIQQCSAAVARFKATGRRGESLELLVSHPAAKKDITVDGMIAEKLVRRIHGRPRRMSAADLSSLLQLTALMAAEEADLDEEAKGLRLGAESSWISAPRVVLHGDRLLLETALEGCRVEELPSPRREPTYREAVRGWARMLLEDGILNTFVRRDELRVDGNNIGLTRWAGAYRPGPAVQAFLPSLVRAAFGRSAVDRARERSRLLGLLAWGMGISGSLEDLADLCVELVSQGGPLQVARPLMPGLFIGQEPAAGPDRMGLTRLLRQLVWFRDLGLACEAVDLSWPWRELAQEPACD